MPWTFCTDATLGNSNGWSAAESTISDPYPSNRPQNVTTVSMFWIRDSGIWCARRCRMPVRKNTWWVVSTKCSVRHRNTGAITSQMIRATTMTATASHPQL